ncbi:hypothetical protein ACXZ1M_20390 [Duganella sp. PWIR1]
MESEKPAVWCLGTDINLANDVRRIYPTRFAGVFAIVFLFVGAVAFAALSKIPPSAMAEPPARIAVAALQIVAWKLSGGHLWPIAVPGVLRALAPAGAVAVVAAKAILAACLGTWAAWKLARGALTPRDGYRHIRGSRIYKGEEAKRILADQLRLKN